ncbi:Flp family type IVb pilin [Pseudomonas sp.]|uniref:Flp family type IVb pilin n=1 Tax=Pseudomonas sp. TaxID=306 RepID=UPI00260917AB|nr:Flp family type IVb pilin [Pseudomonas sp.]
MFLNTVLKVYIPAQVFVTRQAKLFLKRTDGASGIEYAIIAAMVAVVIVGFSADIRDEVSTVFTSIKDGLVKVNT